MRFQRLAVPALILGLALPAHAAQKPRTVAPAALSPVPTISADSEGRWVNFELTPGNQMVFRMIVNGRTATAVLDTGVNFTLVSTAFAASLGLKPVATAQASAIGGTLAISWAPVESLGFGGLTRAGGRVGVADLAALASGTTSPVEVVVGADLLSQHALDIDFDGRRFRMLPSGRMPFRGTSVPLAIQPQSGVFTIAMTVGAATLRPLMIDTGDGAFLTVSREAWVGTKLPDVGMTSAYAVGLAGPVETDMAVLPAVRIGTLTARHVEVRVEPPKGYSTSTGTAGRIGTGLLQHYRVLFDPRARRMILSPGPSADTPPLKSTSGLLLSYEYRSLRVVHVMKNSPAAADGWRAGERICSVDGTRLPADYRSSTLGTWPAGKPGRIVRLGLCDGGAKRSLTLATFY